MKKKIVYYKNMSCRCGCIHNGIMYSDGELRTYPLEEDEGVCEINVKTLAVHTMKNKGTINKEKKIMELEKRNGSLAIVRDEFDNKYISLLCETYYSEFSNGIVIDNIIVTPLDKMSADYGAETGDTKKRWVIFKKLS